MQELGILRLAVSNRTLPLNIALLINFMGVKCHYAADKQFKRFTTEFFILNIFTLDFLRTNLKTAVGNCINWEYDDDNDENYNRHIHQNSLTIVVNITLSHINMFETVESLKLQRIRYKYQHKLLKMITLLRYSSTKQSTRSRVHRARASSALSLIMQLFRQTK